MPAKASITIARSGPIDADVCVPSSKSLTQRALVAAALARGRSEIVHPLSADDTNLMAEALRRLGIEVRSAADPWSVVGCAGRIPAGEARLDLGNAGTAMRFLTPVVATGHGRFVLDGTERMRRRPIGDLLAALSALGVPARSIEGNGCPPVEIVATGLRGGAVTIRGDVSSQFVSGLLLAGPLAESGLLVHIEGALVSRPYVEMTLQVMERFGARVAREGIESYGVAGGAGYTAARFEVEGDASSACWWFAAAAVTGGRARVRGIPIASKQGDLAFLGLLEEMGCRVTRGPQDEIAVEGGSLRGIDADLRDMPDTAPALGAVAIFASTPTRLRGAAHLRDKESDRISGLAVGLGRLGAFTEEHRDGLTIRPGPLAPALLDPLGDHRLAMAFAVAGLGIGGVEILDPGCVTKSYPGFFEALSAAARPVA